MCIKAYLLKFQAKFEFFDKSLNSVNDMTSAPPLKFNFNMIQLLITMKKLVATNEVFYFSIYLNFRICVFCLWLCFSVCF